MTIYLYKTSFLEKTLLKIFLGAFRLVICDRRRIRTLTDGAEIRSSIH